VAKDFLSVVSAIATAARTKCAVVVMLGGHIVKTGLAPLIIELMNRRVITHLAMNGSAAIHDYEIARFGATSEDVARGLVDGTFGMAEETGRGMNEAFIAGMKNEWGMGEALARALENLTLSNGDLSVLLAAQRLGIPCTVHAAIGAEIIHQHPAASGAAIGDTSHRDFRRLAASLPGLHDGGVVLNLGSAVIMPEVFLKALTIARNLNAGKPTGFMEYPRELPMADAPAERIAHWHEFHAHADDTMLPVPTVMAPALLNPFASVKARPLRMLKLPAALLAVKLLIAGNDEFAPSRMTAASLVVMVRLPRLRVPLSSTW
jgi:hypothetical protein